MKQEQQPNEVKTTGREIEEVMTMSEIIVQTIKFDDENGHYGVVVLTDDQDKGYSRVIVKIDNNDATVISTEILPDHRLMVLGSVLGTMAKILQLLS